MFAVESGILARSTLSESDLSLTSMTLLESFSSHKQSIQMGREEACFDILNWTTNWIYGSNISWDNCEI